MILRDNLEIITESIVGANGYSLNETSSENMIVFDIKVPKPDVGKMIGKKGRTIEAIRHIINAIATRKKMRVLVNISDYTH